MAKSKNINILRTPVIPKDWVMKELGQLFDFKNGINASKEDYGNGVKFINVMEVIYHDCIIANMIPGSVKISKKQINDFSVKRGEVLFNRTSETTNEIGLAAVYLDDEKVVFGGFVIRGVPKDKSLFDEYKKYCFHSKFVRDQIIKVGQGAVRTNIGQGDLEKVKLPFPALPEQKAIAHILSLMDIEIKKNNELISKKGLQKKWLMQNLLTGKKRLLSNKSEAKTNKWITVKLGDTFEFIKTYSISREGLSKISSEDLIYCIHYGDIHALYENEFLDFSVQQSIPQIIDETQAINERDYLKDGDIIMADASEDYEGVGEVVEVVNLDNKIAVGGLHTIVLRGNNDIIVNGFSGYLFSGEVVRNRLRKLATGSSVYSVTKTTLQNLTLVIPGSLKEQTAIANVMQAADKEIQLLKAKRDKLKEKKKGLMQILLTGKKRLKTK